MKPVAEAWKTTDRVSLFVVSLVLLLVLLVTGLLVADRSLRESVNQQATADATTSAKIVAQEVELAGEQLYEFGTGSAKEGKSDRLPMRMPANTGEHPIRAVWVLDTLGVAVLDSARWDGRSGDRKDLGVSIRRISRRVAASRQLQLQGLPRHGRSPTPGSTTPGQALLGEPVVEDGQFRAIAVALVDEAALLAPAESAMVQGRSFLALLVDGDTVTRSIEPGRRGQQSAPVRLPLPGEPAWFVITGQTSRENASRVAIWSLGSMALLLLLFGLLRERRQTARIAERSTELERLSAELLRANRMKSEFLANVSHELRTPLNAIVGFVDLLRDGGYGALSERQRSPVERIATSANRLRTLVDQVLDIAKIAAGRLEVRLETITVRAFLANVVSEIEPLLRERGLSANIVPSGDLPRLRTDPTHLRQILVNLLGNAVKYTEHGGVEVRSHIDRIGPPPRTLAATGQHPAVRSEGTEEWAVIEVADTGIGVAQVDLERIFDEFEQIRPQVSAETGPGMRGTGLGLAISRRLAALLGGDVTVESTVGVGSTFTVWLPVRDTQSSAG